MNVIFGTIILLSSVILLFTRPDALLSSMLSGGEKALSLTLKMTVIYAVWMGIFALLEKSSLSVKIAKLLRPLNKFLFGEVPEKAGDFISMNVSANVLGMSGATTPMGIKAVNELEKHKGTEYAIAMFFVVNATSVQIIPSSVLALRVKMGAATPADIILPTILSTMLSTVIGVLLVKIFVKRKKAF